MNVQNINTTNFDFQNINTTPSQNKAPQPTSSVFNSYQNDQFEYSKNTVNSMISSPPALNKPIPQKEVSLKASSETKKAAKVKQTAPQKRVQTTHQKINQRVQAYGKAMGQAYGLPKNSWTQKSIQKVHKMTTDKSVTKKVLGFGILIASPLWVPVTYGVDTLRGFLGL